MNYRKSWLCGLALLCITFSLAQNKKALPGFWYGKLTDRQHTATAKIFTKHEIEESRQKLTIDSKLYYTYSEITDTGKLVTTGRVVLKDGHIIFTPTDGIKNYDAQEFYLYLLNDEQLIYSSSFVPKPQPPKEESIFQRVEVSAVYKDGTPTLLEILYQQMGQAVNPDTAYQNTYRLVIDTSGTAQVSTLKVITATPEYFDAVKRALMILPGLFTPALQNGRRVKAWMEFSITY